MNKSLAKLLSSAVVLGSVFFSLQTMASPQDWQRIKRPIPATDGKANPIGSYSNGCIIGAEPLPYKGEGYQVIRMNKNRYYGHPDMIAYLQRLGQKAKSAGLPTMLVGDIAMPGGGRFLTGHASHQMGLDADIWLRMGTMTDSEALNSDGKGLLVVNRQTQRVDENVWNNNHATLIKLAAQDPKVTRIFVNPAIKLKLCQTAIESIKRIIVVITYILVRNIQGILEVLIFSRVKLSQGTPYTITTLLTYIFVAVGGAWAFSTLGMSWSKLQWLFAALSVGLGFGMQEIFANFVSGIILLFERPIRVGDTVTINDVTGTVAKIRIRAITMIDPDRKEVIVPNKSFVTGQVINWALSNTVTRLVVSVGVAYGSDLDLVKRLLLQAAHEQPSVLKDPEPRALFLTFGASTLDHELRVYVGQVSERNDTLDALNRRVNELFAENNIDIAFNQLDIFIKNKDTGEEIPFIDVAKLAKSH